MTPPAPDPELRQLIDTLMDEGRLSRALMERLEEMLESPDALAYYLSVTSIEGMMPEALASDESRGPLRKRSYFPMQRACQVAAACAVFLLGWWLGERSTPGNVAPTTVSEPARITGLVGVQWKKGGAPDLISGSAAANRLAVESGLVEITYANGVRVTLEGPADFSVTDATSGKLGSGKLVASVPKGAEGFRVDYPEGNVVDLGTEFAMEAHSNGTTEVGVLDGMVNLNLPGEEPRLLLVNQAVLHDQDAAEPLQAIPLNREKFVRRLPSRDFRWSMTSLSPQTLEFDVSHLIWKGSRYRAIFKWIQGQDAILVKDVELCLDGRTLVGDPHTGATGILSTVKDNVYSLDLKPGDFQRGRWTLRVTIEGYPRTATLTGPVQSQGILQLEEGLVSSAGPQDFIGRWSYHHLGQHFVREFHKDGTVTLEMNGKPLGSEFRGSHWTVDHGVLVTTLPDLKSEERHVLRNADTLIFVSMPYDNATMVKGG